MLVDNEAKQICKITGDCEANFYHEVNSGTRYASLKPFLPKFFKSIFFKQPQQAILEEFEYQPSLKPVRYSKQLKPDKGIKYGRNYDKKEAWISRLLQKTSKLDFFNHRKLFTLLPLQSSWSLRT